MPLPGGPRRVVWVDGRVCEESEACISPFDHGLLTGDGVFEVLKVYAGRPFAARRHLERLARSTAGMRLECPDPDLMRRAMDEVIAANAIDDGRLRITVTGGVAPLGSDRSPTARPLVLVAGGSLPAWPESTDVCVVPWVRNERSALAGLKSTSYGENVVALAYARERGAGEAVFANTCSDLCEGTGSNVFLATRGRLRTPPLSSGCLAGVTRALLVEIADVVEESLPVAALADADEAFLTSTTREVQPIRAVDGIVLPAVPGPITALVAESFAALVARDIDP